jgi:hypothetical protein
MKNLFLTFQSPLINLTLVKETISKNIQIRINEYQVSVPSNTTLFHLKGQFKPNADLIIYNGFPVNSDRPLGEEDEIVFIKK